MASSTRTDDRGENELLTEQASSLRRTEWHLAARRELSLEEKVLKSSTPFLTNMSPMSRKAHEIVDRIRQCERNTFWCPRESAHHGPIYPDMPIRLAGNLMEQTHLWRIVNRMPKGAQLHAHLEAMISIPWLISTALNTPGMAFKASEPLCSAESMQRAMLQFQWAGNIDQSDDPPSIYSAEYVPSTLVPVSKAVTTFPSGKLDCVGFESLLLTRSKLCYDHGPKALWKAFATAFTLPTSILLYEPIFVAALERLFTALDSDGISYSEFRLVITHPFYPRESKKPSATLDPLIVAFAGALSAFREEHPSFSARLILCVGRTQPIDVIRTAANSAIALKKAHPNVIAGFDLVGHEVDSATLEQLLLVLEQFKPLCDEAGVTLPLLLHAGETVAANSPTANNMLDALLLDSPRLGHATALAARPLIVEKVLRSGAVVEACPVSNEILGLVPVAAHPAQALLNMGVKVVLGTDDPAIFWAGDDEAKAMSREFWAVLQSWEGVGLGGAGAMIQQSLMTAFLGDESSERIGMLADWRMKWEEFCRWIVEMYGAVWGEMVQG